MRAPERRNGERWSTRRSPVGPKSQSLHGAVAWVVRLQFRRTPCVGGDLSPAAGSALACPHSDAEPLPASRSTHPTRTLQLTPSGLAAGTSQGISEELVALGTRPRFYPVQRHVKRGDRTGWCRTTGAKRLAARALPDVPPPRVVGGRAGVARVPLSSVRRTQVLGSCNKRVVTAFKQKC
jgi:hypothetical protein